MHVDLDVVGYPTLRPNIYYFYFKDPAGTATLAATIPESQFAGIDATGDRTLSIETNIDALYDGDYIEVWVEDINNAFVHTTHIETTSVVSHSEAIKKAWFGRKN